MSQRPSTATSPLLRRLNATAVLGALRGSGSMTGTELMEVTGLSRPTVHAVCDELIALGWVRELEPRAPEDPTRPGRRARHYAFHAAAGHVLGVDLGAHKVTAQLADLAGRPVAEETRAFRSDDVGAAERLADVRAAVRTACARAGTSPSAVLATGLAVPGPVDAAGRASVPWLPGLAGADLPAALRDAADGPALGAGPVLLENDANLAVTAERWRGAARGAEDVVLVLAGERLGAGVVLGGRLLRGAAGGTGELGFLSLVEGVGGTEGVGRLAQLLGAQAVRAATGAGAGAATGAGAPGGLLELTGGDPGRVGAEAVVATARAGDPLAAAVVEAVAERVARVLAVLAVLLDPALLVVGGAVAGAGDVVLEPLRRRLAVLCERPPQLVASALGERAVVTGAVRLALDHVEATPLDRGPLPSGEGSAPPPAP